MSCGLRSKSGGANDPGFAVNADTISVCVALGVDGNDVDGADVELLQQTIKNIRKRGETK